MHRAARFALAVLALMLVPSLVRAQPADSYCQINTGLDPACPLTSAGIDLSTSTLSGTATLHDDTIFGSMAWRGNQQLSIALPLFEHLSIAGVGDAYGTGDIGLQYTYAFGSGKRLTQVAGLAATFPTGAAAFSNGSVQLAPSYALSYAVGNTISLVAIAQYAFPAGGTWLPFAPRTQEFTVIPRAIVDWSRSGIYTAFEAQGSNVTGDLRYQSYFAEATAGIARPHYNLSFTYAVPTTTFTRENVFQRRFSVQLSWRP
jgi:hypothetical protein